MPAATNLGTRRHCQACGASYYDFATSPIKCPSPDCGAEFDPEILLKSRRVRPVPAQPAAKKPDGGDGDGDVDGDAVAVAEIEDTPIDGDIENVDEAGADDTTEVIDDDSDIIKVKKDDDDDEEAVVADLDAAHAGAGSDDDDDDDDESDSDDDDAESGDDTSGPVQG